MVTAMQNKNDKFTEREEEKIEPTKKEQPTEQQKCTSESMNCVGKDTRANSKGSVTRICSGKIDSHVKMHVTQEKRKLLAGETHDNTFDGSGFQIVDRNHVRTKCNAQGKRTNIGPQRTTRTTRRQMHRRGILEDAVHANSTPVKDKHGPVQQRCSRMLGKKVMLLALVGFGMLGVASSVLTMWGKKFSRQTHRTKTGCGESQERNETTWMHPTGDPGQGSKGGTPTCSNKYSYS